MMHHHFEAAEIASLFRSIRQLWDGRNLTIVEGANTRFGIGNDLLEGALSVTRILCPNKNAYEELEQIKERCSGADPGNLFLVALGPAAKPLVMHLQESGLRALDVGHLDIEYEWYRRSAKTPSPVPGKAVNEAGTRGYEADEAEQTDFANYLRP